MKKSIEIVTCFFVITLLFSCANSDKNKSNESIVKDKSNLNAKDILGNPEYLAISYGGYRTNSRDIQPTIKELKEDMRILSAMGIKMLRTYNVHYDHAENLLEAIHQLNNEDSSFEMYVMLGIWIDCKNAFYRNGEHPDHNHESERNPVEVKTAVELAKKYPDIVKVLAVGNEAMVKWATEYYVQPGIILKWVNHLQNLKKTGELSKDLWITSSDNFASWGGHGEEYHVEDLNKLIKAVDYISMHTYAYHDTHYTPDYWINDDKERSSDLEIIEAAMLRAKHYAMSQYQSVKSYIESLNITKPIHIGESGWASVSNGLYGANGSKATDEYKAALYYKHIRDWTNKEGLSCFFFEAFDENWKDGQNPLGSENHFGLITRDGQAKYALWDLVDQGVFEGLTRNGNPITKTYNGNVNDLMKDVLVPNIKTTVE
ncbi:glycosyl hydrolase family 17 protein [Psychroserpens sp.]|uniref:glycosyl hydrolase family 17 protein n=1 Tax=Psychroserpens sp. TaxID=2020870 RepID=UPI002B26AF56|nr:glycosyl hydrolase family 17 protein [Psychroserpens sp.]